MGGKASLGPFDPEDSFLRRVSTKAAIKDGTVGWRAFDDQHPTLSFTFQDDDLQTGPGMQTYQRDKALPSGDLPGICKLTLYDLTESLRPPLPPRADRDPEDEKYGHLHCCTDCPVNDDHRRKMAKLATRNGILREFVRKGRRSLGPR